MVKTTLEIFILIKIYSILAILLLKYTYANVTYWLGAGLQPQNWKTIPDKRVLFPSFAPRLKHGKTPI